jgi:hypothetical protein
MSQVTWKVQGNILLEHKDSVIGNAFPDQVPLKGVKVRVSAREKILGVWGTFNSWDEDTTDENGFFSVKKEKDKSDRQFKIEVLFKDDSLKLYPDNDGFLNALTEFVTDLGGVISDYAEDAVQQLLEQTSRVAFDVKWFTILDEDKDDNDHEHGTIDFGNFVFNKDTGSDLNDNTAVKHAFAWFVIKQAFSVLNSFGTNRKFDDKPVALKYPHDNPLIGDKIEAPYSDPYNYVIFVIRNSKDDWFSLDTVLHELMHIWAFQHCSGEKAMAWQLMIHGSTHENIQKKSFVAFHEGFADWAKDRLINIIFKKTDDKYILPYSRAYLKSKGVSGESELDKSEYAWNSLFNILITPNLHYYDFNNTTSNYAVKLKAIALTKDQVCSSPSLKFEDILSVFCAHESKGYKNVISKDEMNMDDFLKRTADIFSAMTNDHIDVLMNLLNPTKTNTAASVVCPVPSSSASATAAEKKKDYKPTKDLHEEPVKR